MPGPKPGALPLGDDPISSLTQVKLYHTPDRFASRASVARGFVALGLCVPIARFHVCRLIGRRLAEV